MNYEIKMHKIRLFDQKLGKMIQFQRLSRAKKNYYSIAMVLLMKSAKNEKPQTLTTLIDWVMLA